jgi:hypothetical protein
MEPLCDEFGDLQVEEEVDMNEVEWEDLVVDRLNELVEENGLFPRSGFFKSVIVDWKGKEYVCKVNSTDFEMDGDAATINSVDVASVREARQGDKEEFVREFM